MATKDATKRLKLGGVEIDVPILPDRHGRKLTTRPHSKNNGLSLYQFLYELFHQNEKLDKGQKLNDTQITAVVKAEFASFPEVIESITNCRVSRITVWRSVFNRGKMGKPEMVSFRYDDTGRAVDGHTSRKLLSPEDQKEVARRYGIADPRFVV